MRATVAFCMIGFFVVLVFSGNAMAETLFFDDFEDGKDEWPDFPVLTIEEDPENAANHVLAYDTLADKSNADALFLERYEDLQDYTIQARFNIVGESGNYAVAGLIVRAQTATEYMLVEPAVNRQGVRGIVNVFDRGAGWAIVADGQIELEMNNWYELSVTVEGKNLTASIDGKLIAEFDDVLYPAGGFGIRQWDSKALYDDVEVYDAEGSDMPVEPRGKLAAVWGALKTVDL